VSDVNGHSARPRFTEVIVETLRGFGYSVAVNDPYTGGTIVHKIGAPERGVDSVQVEINRSLYLDENTVEKTGNFGALAEHLEWLTTVLVGAA
jgi:N-formylglutamate deformylase